MPVNIDGDNVTNLVLSSAEDFNKCFRGKVMGAGFPGGLLSAVTATIFINNIEFDKLEVESIIGYFYMLNYPNSKISLMGSDNNFHTRLCDIVLAEAKNNSKLYNVWVNNFLRYHEEAFTQFININNIDVIIHSFYYYLYSNPLNRIRQPKHYSYNNVVKMLDIIRHKIVLLGEVTRFSNMFISFAPPDDDYRVWIDDDVYAYIDLVKKDFYYNLANDYKLGVML